MSKYLEMSMESVDLLLVLLDAHKPHLKPYSSRLRSWIGLLNEYNHVAGTQYKQARTLKKRFERIIDAYKNNRSSIVCENRDLLDKLVEEYNKPYRLINKKELTPDTITIAVASSEESSSNDIDNTSIKFQSNNTDKSNNCVRKRLSKPDVRITDATTKKKSKHSNHDNIFTSFDASEFFGSATTSEESSSQPPPLDTINLGMPRSFNLTNETSVEDIEPQTSLSTAFYPAKKSKNPKNPLYQIKSEKGLPQSFFILDNNKKLIELKSLAPQSNETNAKEFRRNSIPLISKVEPPCGIFRGQKDEPGKPHESVIMTELLNLKKEHRLFQSTILKKLDSIMTLLAHTVDNRQFTIPSREDSLYKHKATR